MREETEAALVEAARRITVPALLVRGTSSELVSEAHVREFLELVPHAEYMDVAGARHMVAGDRNDRFSAAILEVPRQARVTIGDPRASIMARAGRVL